MGREEPHAVHQRVVQSPAPGQELFPCINKRWRLTSWKAASLRKKWESCGTTRWPWGSNVVVQQRKPTHSWAAWGKTLPQRQGRWYFLSLQHWWGHMWSVVSKPHLPTTREMWTHWNELIKETGASVISGEAERTVTCSAWKREDSGTSSVTSSINIFWWEHRVRLLSCFQ